MNVLRVWWAYWRVGAMNEMQYRVNFFVQLFQSALALATGLLVLGLIFSYTPDLSGWSQAELLVVMGVHIFVGGVIRTAIQPNMERIMQDIQQGTLDYALAKPEDSQIIVSVRETRVWQSVDIFTGLAVLVYAVIALQEQIGVVESLAFVVALLLGVVMIYSFWLILTTGAFWVVRVEETLNLFQGMYAAGRWPVGIYPDWLRLSLTFLVPIAFAVTVPAEALTGRLTLETLAGAAVLAAALLLLARWVWFRGLRRYSGASA
jgi:ABC-2 type transport system permease protein